MVSPVKPIHEGVLWIGFFDLQRDSPVTLQAQVRAAIVKAILDRRLLPGVTMPPTRTLAAILKVGRNTILRAYERLVDEGFLVADPRSGHSVSLKAYTDAAPAWTPEPLPRTSSVDWSRRLGEHVSALPHVAKPEDWQRYPYPFVYGQFDPSLFPAMGWREATQLAVRRVAVRDWAGDRVDRDDPELVEQIQARVLTRRGVWVSPDEILITAGAQQAMFIVAALIRARARCVGLEDPGYPDLRNVLRFFSIPMCNLPLDEHGLKPGRRLDECDYVCVAPSHQNPTSITMPVSRRRALLEQAERSDFVILEDDYDSELNFEGEATPAIKSLDAAGRVVYVGSLSKTLAAGLRIGYLVAPPAFIDEARAVRRLIQRHPPANNQRAAALFLSLGHYDALIPKLVRTYRERAQILCNALARYLPEAQFTPPRGGSALWVQAPEGTDMRAIRERARAVGVLFDAGDTFYASRYSPLNFFRLGYSSIPAERIEAGVKLLADCIRRR